MTKMVICSFYNALIDSEDAIPTSTMLEIERIRNKGILFVVGTNRSYQEVLEYNRDFPFVDYIVSLNGGIVYDVNQNEILVKHKISQSTKKKIIENFSEYSTTFYTEKKKKSTLPEEDIYKIEMKVGKEEKTLYEKLQKYKIEYTVFQKDRKKVVEIVSNKCNMFTGVDRISLKNNIPLNQIVCVCANDSDMVLVNNISNHFIMENSVDSLKQITNKMTSSHNQKGLEKVLKEI